MKAGREPKPGVEARPKQKKKKYASPKLRNFGTISKLTLGGSGTVGDGQGHSMPPCL